MKKYTLITTASICAFMAIISSCTSPAEKVESAKTEVDNANRKLESANNVYQADIENYKLSTAQKISENNKIIADYKLVIKNKDAKVRAILDKEITKLELKNDEMRVKMENYAGEGKESWESFKTEFNRDMAELATAFHNLTVSNTK